MQYPYLENNSVQKALAASGIGIWRYDVESKNFTIDSQAKELLNISDSTLSLDTLCNSLSDKYGKIVFKAFKNLSQNLNVDFLTKDNFHHLIFKGEFDADSNAYHGILQKQDFFLEEDSNNIFRSLIEEAPVATCLFVGSEMKVEVANDVMLGYWGKDRSVLGLPIIDAIPELKGQPFIDILERIFTTGETHQEFEAMVQLEVNGVLGTYYFDYTYKPLKNNNGEVYAIMDMAVDVTERVINKQKLQNSESKISSIIQQSPLALAFLKGEDMVVEIANEKMFEFWGKQSSITGLPITEGLPEIKNQKFVDLLKNVYKTGITYKGYDELAKLNYNGVLTDVYFDFTYSAIRDEKGVTSGVLIAATDVSDRVHNINLLAESEEKFRSVVYSAPAAVAVFSGRDLVTDIANNAFLQFVGRTKDDFVGKPLLEAMPEIRGQESVELMLEVFEKGIKTHHFGRRVDIMRNGVLTENYYNVSYTPLFDALGNVYGILDIAIDVTETIRSQQALEKAEESLRGAIELAELGTWTYYPDTDEMQFSDRLLEWFGVAGKLYLSDLLEKIHPNDRERIKNSLVSIYEAESEGIMEEEFTLVNKYNTTKRILHTQGKAFYDDSGKAYIISGTTQDVTQQKQIQLALENQVKERTEALREANKELEQMNLRLVGSNEELAQYAYVASHDLQEPLRKISMFSNLLKERDKDNAHTSIINKIVNSSQRMSLLIRDLLEFSRLLNTDIRFTETNLNYIVNAVVEDFELLIEEKEAVIKIESLPVIDAIPLQMNQLFYNLIGNALKFVGEDKQPYISVTCKKVTKEYAENYIAKIQQTPYYHIAISDNGIGIEEKYQKQIFEVFKRLHSRTEYSGSGIGLAICRRIISNHKGIIFTQSELGKGTTFNIIIPAAQKAGELNF